MVVAILSSLIAALAGTIVGGVITAWSTRDSVRRILDAQVDLQSREWQRRAAERDQERHDREEAERVDRHGRSTAAAQTLAMEALWNSGLILIAANEARMAP